MTPTKTEENLKRVIEIIVMVLKAVGGLRILKQRMMYKRRMKDEKGYKEEEKKVPQTKLEKIKQLALDLEKEITTIEV